MKNGQKNQAETTGNRYEIEILMSRTQKLKGLSAASLRLKTFNDNPYLLRIMCLCQARHMLKQDRTIIHVEDKNTHEHFYFGSAAATIEDSRVKNLLKIKYQTFRTKRISEDKP